MKSRDFFPLPAADRWYLAALLAVAVLAFSPWARATHLAGLPVFAWLMTTLMVVAPTVALVRLLRDRRG